MASEMFTHSIKNVERLAPLVRVGDYAVAVDFTEGTGVLRKMAGELTESAKDLIGFTVRSLKAAVTGGDDALLEDPRGALTELHSVLNGIRFMLDMSAALDEAERSEAGAKLRVESDVARR